MSETDTTEAAIHVELHKKFFGRCMKLLPKEYTSLDTSRPTVTFFGISGLDILGGLDDLGDARKAEIIEWVYAHQIVPDAEGSDASRAKCGFRGSTSLGMPFDCSHEPKTLDPPIEYDCSHIAQTYCSLLLLVILGDDLTRVRRWDILEALKQLQKPDGSYFSTVQGSESDVRFVYCAAAISHILNDWRGMNRDTATQYILSSIGYDYGIGQGPGQEGHGGSTFCGVAALSLMDRLGDMSPAQREGLISWLIYRQHFGFEGRPNKIPDSCYSFWIGGALKLLDAYKYVDAANLKQFIAKCQFQPIGGFSKYADPECPPDILHSYFSVCGLSLMGAEPLKPMHAALNISLEAATRLKSTPMHS